MEGVHKEFSKTGPSQGFWWTEVLQWGPGAKRREGVPRNEVPPPSKKLKQKVVLV